jgi:exodeoxyribonuclease V gamma subunit
LPFVTAPLPAAPLTELTVDELVEFFRHPIRWFLRQELQLSLAGDEETSDDREPIELSYLERWRVGDRLLSGLLAGIDIEATVPLLRAGGLLPHGTPGRTQVEEHLATAVRIHAAAVAEGVGAPLEPCEVRLPIDGVALTGILQRRAAAGLVRAQFSRVAGRSELELWIRHLVLNAALDPAASSVLIGRAPSGPEIAIACFAPVPDAARHLGTLIGLFRRGQSIPLPLFKAASREYAMGLRGKKATFAGARGKARKAFEGSESRPGDGADPYVVQVYPELPAELREDGTADETAELFTVARAVFDPLLDYREKR